VNAPTTVTATFDPAPVTGYSYKKCFDGNTTATGANISSTQSGFPIAVHICPNCTSPNFTATEKTHFFGSWDANGKRVQFLASDQTTILPYEVEYYNATSGSEEAIYWVKVPTIAGNNANSSMVCVAYGNDPNGSDQDNKTGVWDSNFKMVQHMGGSGTGGTVADSTVNANNGTRYGDTTQVTGQVQYGQTFDGSGDYVSVADNSGLSFPNETFTFSCWINTSQTSKNDHKYFIAKGAGGNYEYQLSKYYNTNKAAVSIYNLSASAYNEVISAGNINDGTWKLITGTADGSTLRLYINGTVEASTASITASMGNGSAALTLAQRGDVGANGYYAGLLDEIRISSTARSADWIKLEYYSLRKTNWNGDSWLTWNTETH
jgi:hypothetical protein